MRDIALTLFVFGLIPYILMRPYVGLLVWSWLGYMNPHRLCYGFAYSFPWVQVIAILTFVSILLNKENRRTPKTSVSILLIAFFAWATVTTFFAAETDSAWQHWNEFGKTLIMVWVTLILVNDQRRMHMLVWLIVVSLGFYGLKGGIFTMLRGGTQTVFGPTGSFIADNNDLAQALCMILPLMQYLRMHSSGRLVRVGVGLSMLVTGVAILGTYSRGGLVALAVVSGVLFLKSRRRIALIAVFAVLGYTGYHFMPAQWLARMDTLQHASQVNTLQTRIQSWEFAANVAVHHPVVGGGFDVYKSASMWERYGPEGAQSRAIHSIYFRILGEHGFLGLVLFLGLLFASWWSCTRVRKATRHSLEQRWAYDLSSMLQVSLIAFMTAGLATTSSYFDLSYQLMAMCSLLVIITANQKATAMTDREAVPTLSKVRGQEEVATYQ
jgi:probable O-glycosylation ligase (exosortase A-associated)